MTAEQLVEAFPDNDAAELLFVTRRWPNGVVCPLCSLRRRAGRHGAPTDAVSLPGVRPLFLGAYGNGHAKVQDRLPRLADRYAPGADPRGQAKGTLHLEDELGITQKSAWWLVRRIGDALAEND